ncbi:MAG: hypothetical protein Q8P46_00485 [Hyphomicrobiales bacterium]|nr:hypothetical protein [Hyphomicrobiales bacterium]
MRTEEFRVEDLDRLKNFGGQEYLVPLVDRGQLATAIQLGAHYSFWSGDDLVGCAGIIPVHEWRAVTWALLQQGETRRFAGLHRAVSAVLRAQSYPRIEAYVDPAFAPAMRWTAMLGFEIETAFKPFWFPDGRGAAEWVLYRGG